uniref:Uncharacterized protein n=1 Tax=Globodera rostochiensis TaxID=31243 RepID=A0A914GTM1_GLORO
MFGETREATNDGWKGREWRIWRSDRWNRGKEKHRKSISRSGAPEAFFCRSGALRALPLSCRSAERL